MFPSGNTIMKCVPLQVIKGAEILEVLHSLPSVRQYLFSLYECQYSDFFQSLGKEPFFLLTNITEKCHFVSAHV